MTSKSVAKSNEYCDHNFKYQTDFDAMKVVFLCRICSLELRFPLKPGTEHLYKYILFGGRCLYPKNKIEFKKKGKKNEQSAR